MTQPLSSGRWDATGSWHTAVEQEELKAFAWAENLSLLGLKLVLEDMADDTNAYSLYERKAALKRAARTLQ